MSIFKKFESIAVGIRPWIHTGGSGTLQSSVHEGLKFLLPYDLKIFALGGIWSSIWILEFQSTRSFCKLLLIFKFKPQSLNHYYISILRLHVNVSACCSCSKKVQLSCWFATSGENNFEESATWPDWKLT